MRVFQIYEKIRNFTVRKRSLAFTHARDITWKTVQIEKSNKQIPRGNRADVDVHEVVGSDRSSTRKERDGYETWTARGFAPAFINQTDSSGV